MESENETSNLLPEMKVRHKAVRLSVMGAFLDGYDLLLIGVVLLSLIPQWNLTALEIGLVTACSFLGMIIGGGVFGIVADKIGRRKVFMMVMFIFVFGAILCGLSQNITQLIIFRFLIGLAIGMDAPTSTSIIAEFSDNKNRGKNTALMQIFWPLGAVIASIVALVLHHYMGPDAWRWMFISGVLPAGIVIYLRKDLPETPFWKKDMKNNEAISNNKIVPKPIKKPGSLKDLFQTPWLKSIIFVSIYWGLTNLSSGLFLFMPYIAKESFNLIDTGAIIFSASVTLIEVITLTILAFKVIDRSGRKPMTIVGLSLASLMALILAFSHGNTLIMTITFCIMMVSLMAPGQGAYWAWSVELFPTRLRATASGVATAIGKTGSLIATLFFPLYLESFGWKIALLSYSIVFLVALFVVVFLAPESKNLVLSELDEIDSEFSPKSTSQVLSV